MAKIKLSKDELEAIKGYLDSHRYPELINTYLFFIEKKHKIQPVLFPREKKIYQSLDNLVSLLEAEGRLWKETEIKIGFSDQNVNEQTTKIYICPFTGKVFGDNTHPNPQDAIYDWVSKCPQNTERAGGLRVKRFFVSDDPEVIKNYIPKDKPRRTTISKIVFSSALSGKLFNTKEAVIEDFKRHYIKKMSLIEVQGQNRYEIEEHFLAFIQENLNEEALSTFVEALSEHEEFEPYIESWFASEEEEEVDIIVVDEE